jgi:type IV pilus assembly protein PilP
MKKRNSAYLILACCCCLVLICGCKKKETPPPAPTAAPVLSKPANVQPVSTQGIMSSAQMGVSAESGFDISSKKDPFKPYVIEQKAAKPLHRTASVNALPIQQFEVRQFKVAGIIVGLKENKAQIVDPLGRAYVVREGMYIGNNDGKIVKISTSGIDVLELYREDNGKIVRRIIQLTLPKKG